MAGALLVIPDLVMRKRLERKAGELARRIDALSDRRPGHPVHVVGYSAGCFIALEACRRVRSAESLGTVVLLDGAVSPRYDWSGLDDRIHELHSFHSSLDWISGIGPLLFGSNDRQWGPGCGAVGFKNPPAFVTQHKWRPADMRLLHFGGHFTAVAPPFVARRVAPLFDRGAEPQGNH